MREVKKGKIAVVLAAAVVMLLAGCGADDSEKVYLDEIRAEDYVKLSGYKGLSVEQAPPEVTEEQRDAIR